MDTSCKGSDYYDQFLDTTEGRNSIYDHISHPFPLHEYFVTLEHCLFLLILFISLRKAWCEKAEYFTVIAINDLNHCLSLSCCQCLSHGSIIRGSTEWAIDLDEDNLTLEISERQVEWLLLFPGVCIRMTDSGAL